jgi:hypothetical protein
MKITKKASLYAATAATVAVLLGTAALSSASALEANGSNGAYYLIDGGTGQQVPAGTTNQWSSDILGSPSGTDPLALFTGSSDATEVRVFVSPRGSERTPSAWSASSMSGFVGSSKDVQLPAASLATFLLGNPNGVKSAGGNYSLGVAFMKNNGLTVADAGVYYTYISVTAGTGAWTFDTYVPPVAPGTVTGSPAEIDLTATTLDAADGVLSLSVPTGATATIGDPELVNGLSTSTGVLPDFTVTDARVVTHAGWNLTSSVTEFTNSADSTVKIANTQLGIEPVLVSTTAGTGVVSVAAPQLAGSAVYAAPFASATNGAAVGTSTFNANLKFVAPVGKPAGTYTSKLTLTLTSK